MWERRGAPGGGGSHLCGAGAAAVATHSPRALFGAGGSAASGRASERASERAFERWEPGSAEGHPAAACSPAGRLHGAPRPERSKRQTKSPGAEPGEPAEETPVPLCRLPCKPGSDRSPPRRPRARHPGPRLPQGWSKSLRGARCSTPLPGSPPPTDCSRLLARPAQAGEVSCARRLAREPAGGRSKLEASGPWTGAGEAPAAARDGGTCCACWHCSQAVCSQCAGRASTPTTGQ